LIAVLLLLALPVAAFSFSDFLCRWLGWGCPAGTTTTTTIYVPQTVPTTTQPGNTHLAYRDNLSVDLNLCTNTTVAGFFIRSQPVVFGYAKPDHLNDGYKEIDVVVEVYSPSNVVVANNKVLLLLNDMSKILNSSIAISYSRTYVNSSMEYLGGNHTLHVWNGWINLTGNLNLNAGELTAVRYSFQIPQYDTLNFNISINNVIWK
jgi:hypothetical protein